MELTELGWDSSFEESFRALGSESLVPARVAAESRGIYGLMGEAGDWLAEVRGRLRREAGEHGGRGELPAVGDWVAAATRPGGRAAIVEILPRRTALVRKAAGRAVEAQVLAANVDVVLVVAGLDLPLNRRRLERTLALAWESGARPAVVLSKADLAVDADAAHAEAEGLAPGVPVLLASAATGAGLAALGAEIGRGRTAVLVGPSGAGKSSLLNALLGAEARRVGAVRAADRRGRHTTTARQMLVLPAGGVVIDTPGLRELQLWEADDGLARAFEDLGELALRCRFRDCRHRGEPGCAVEAAIARGELAAGRLESHRKMEAELRFLAAKGDPRARREDKARVRRLSKAQKRLARPLSRPDRGAE